MVTVIFQNLWLVVRMITETCLKETQGIADNIAKNITKEFHRLGIMPKEYEYRMVVNRDD